MLPKEFFLFRQSHKNQNLGQRDIPLVATKSSVVAAGNGVPRISCLGGRLRKMGEQRLHICDRVSHKKRGLVTQARSLLNL